MPNTRLEARVGRLARGTVGHGPGVSPVTGQRTLHPGPMFARPERPRVGPPPGGWSGAGHGRALAGALESGRYRAWPCDVCILGGGDPRVSQGFRGSVIPDPGLGDQVVVGRVQAARTPSRIGPLPARTPPGPAATVPSAPFPHPNGAEGVSVAASRGVAGPAARGETLDSSGMRRAHPASCRASCTVWGGNSRKKWEPRKGREVGKLKIPYRCGSFAVRLQKHPPPNVPTSAGSPAVIVVPPVSPLARCGPTGETIIRGPAYRGPAQRDRCRGPAAESGWPPVARPAEWQV